MYKTIFGEEWHGLNINMEKQDLVISSSLRVKSEPKIGDEVRDQELSKLKSNGKSRYEMIAQY